MCARARPCRPRSTSPCRRRCRRARWRLVIVIVIVLVIYIYIYILLIYTKIYVLCGDGAAGDVVAPGGGPLSWRI